MFHKTAVLIVLLWSSNALAGIPLACSPLDLAPNPAMAGEPVTVTVNCQCLTAPQSPVQIDRSGNTVTIAYQAGAGCGVPLPPPPTPVEFDIGAFPPGEFTVIVAPTWVNDGSALDTQEALLGVQAAAIPATRDVLLPAFLLAMLALGLYYHSRKTPMLRR